jgi:hypothetical protein
VPADVRQRAVANRIEALGSDSADASRSSAGRSNHSISRLPPHAITSRRRPPDRRGGFPVRGGDGAGRANPTTNRHSRRRCRAARALIRRIHRDALEFEAIDARSASASDFV